jgi:7-cyano-7-deazaguanine reductase
MALKELDNTNIGKHLGKSSEYACFYDPSLLVREPRKSNRTHLDLDDDNLPFVGNDTWNGYEVTGLTNNGLPIVGICKFVYSCKSKYIVESKSVKLYFNSFSMTHLGDTASEVLREIELRASRDLSKILETDVMVRIEHNYNALYQSINAYIEWSHDLNEKESYITIEDEYSLSGEEFSIYNESPELLRVISSEVAVDQYHSALLRSRCRVTSQPDTGDVYITIKGDKTVDPISLLQYIVSFRDECHFHEEICEAIYKRLYDLLQPEELSVKCLYARRGSWDINPERVSHEKLLHYTLSDPTVVHVKTPRQ